MTNLLAVLLNIAALAGAVWGILFERTALFAVCLSVAIFTMLYIVASKLGFALYQSGEAVSMIYIRRKGKVYHVDRNCPGLEGKKSVRVPASYAWRNHMKPCSYCIKTSDISAREDTEHRKEEGA